MKLTFRRFDLELRHTWRIAYGVGGPGANVFPVVFVQLKNDAGRQGFGEAAPVARYQESVDTVQAFLRQVDPNRLSFEDVPASMRYLESVAPANDAAKCAVNVALLDGSAKAQRQPIYKHLRLGFTEGRHLTSFSIGLDTPEMIRRKVEEAANMPILKLKLGSPDDVVNLAALRSTAPQTRVRVDANEAWRTKEEALRQIEWLHTDGHIEFVEQPMPASTPLADARWLKARSPLPLIADESYHQAADAERCAEGFHGVNVKLVKTSGISGAHEALTAARRLGLRTMIGCMIESSLLISAAAHLADLADYLDLDGNLLISNDPYVGVRTDGGVMSFAPALDPYGLRVRVREGA